MDIAGKDRCINCMMPRKNAGVCPFCGYDERNYKASVTGLPIGTCLYDRYFIGRVLGKGGFGITYSAWDIVLAVPVAIKEYYPEGQVVRSGYNRNKTNVSIFDGGDEADYERGLKEFLQEARILSQFIKYEGIVSVRDFFRENNTAYLVMEYVEGVPLNKYIEMKGPFSPGDVLEKMRPVIKSLGRIHKTGYLHRDISPGNLMYTSQGEIVLIDFGAARIIGSDKQTITVAVKRGYSPEEQYRVRGELGAWTDIYSLSTVMYYMLTGIEPTEAVERVLSDDVKPLSGMDSLDMAPEAKKAIDTGMAVAKDDRLQKVEDLYNLLYPSDKESHVVNDPAWKQYNNKESDRLGKAKENKVSKTMLRREIEELLNKEKDERFRKKVIITAFLICAVVSGIGITKFYVIGEESGREKHVFRPYTTATPEPAKSPGQTVKSMDGADETSEKETGKPATKETDKPATKETDKPATKETDKPATEGTDKPETEEMDKLSAEGTDKPAARPTAKPVKKPWKPSEPEDEDDREPGNDNIEKDNSVGTLDEW